METERLTDTSSRIAISLPLQGVIHITPEIVTGASVDQRLGSQLRYDTQGQKLRLQLIFDLYYRPDVVEWRAEWRDCDGRSIGRGEVTLGKACTDWCVVDIEACRPDGTSLVLAKAADDRLLRITFQASDQRRQTDVDGEATQPAGQE